jgi:hypothetical protein
VGAITSKFGSCDEMSTRLGEGELVLTAIDTLGRELSVCCARVLVLECRATDKKAKSNVARQHMTRIIRQS